MKKQTTQNIQRSGKKNNPHYSTGIFGAIAGVFIGMLIWCLLFQMTHYSGFAGCLLMLGALFGFHLAGKSLNFSGLAICVILSSIAIYFVNNITFSLGIMTENSLSFAEAYNGMSTWMEDSAEFASIYWLNLILGYGTAIITAITVFIRIIYRNRKTSVKNQ